MQTAVFHDKALTPDALREIYITLNGKPRWVCPKTLYSRLWNCDERELMGDEFEASIQIFKDEVWCYIFDYRSGHLTLKFERESFISDAKQALKSFCEDILTNNATRYLSSEGAQKMSRRGFIRNEIGDKKRTYSNGETAYLRIIRQITRGLYLLDEPENSLSAKWQSKLAEFIKISAYSCDCQFIIATHSPFLLGIEGAKIYNLDEEYVTISEWHELESTKLYYELFRKLDGKYQG